MKILVPAFLGVISGALLIAQGLLDDQFVSFTFLCLAAGCFFTAITQPGIPLFPHDSSWLKVLNIKLLLLSFVCFIVGASIAFTLYKLILGRVM